MLEGFKPLDLSGLQAKPLDISSLAANLQPAAPDTKTIAQKILAGTNWNLSQIADSQRKPKANPTFLNGLFDLLSVGNYAVAHGVNDAINANRSDNHDSVLSSILKSGSAFSEGALKGLGAGLRGATAMVGVNDWAANPKDKTRFIDVMQNAQPERFVQQDEHGNYIYQGRQISKKDADWITLKNVLGTTSMDITFDPLSYTGLGLFGKAKSVGELAKVAEEGAGSVKGLLKTAPEKLGELNTPTTDLNATIVNGKITKVPDWFNFPKSAAQVKDVPPVANTLPPTKVEQIAQTLGVDPKGIESMINDLKNGKPAEVTAPTETAPVAAETKTPDFESLMRDMMSAGELTAAKVQKPVETLHRGSILRPEIQSKLAGRITGMMVKNPSNWFAPAAEFITRTHPGMDFNALTSHLYKIRKAPPQFFEKLQKDSAFRTHFIEQLSKSIEQDAKMSPVAYKNERDFARAKKLFEANPTISASDIVENIARGNKAAEEMAAPAHIPGTLNENEAKILEEVIKKRANNVATGVFPGRGAGHEFNVAHGVNAKWSGPNQVNAFNDFVNRLIDLSKTKGLKGYGKYVSPKSRITKAIQMLRQFEDHYMALGHVPYSGTKIDSSVPMRLSDVLAKLGADYISKNPELLTKTLAKGLITGKEEELSAYPEVQQAIEAVKAGGAISDASAASKGIEGGTSVAQSIINEATQSAAQVKNAATISSKAAEAIAKNAGASEGAAKNVASWVKDAFSPKDPVANVMKSAKLNTLQQMSGKIDRFTVDYKLSNAPAITHAIEKTLGVSLRDVGSKVGPMAMVEEWLGARFNAWYMNADMRPVYLAQMGTARATVGLRARQINDLTREFGKDGELWHDAMKVAQGKVLGDGGKSDELAAQITKVMENLFGGSGIRQGAKVESTIHDLESSVAGRAQLLRKELNQTLKRFGINQEFTNASAVKTASGTIRDFSQGTDWLRSWETWNIENPMQFLYQIQNAVEMTVRQRAMFDEVIGRFGTYRTGVAGYSTRLSKATLKKFPYFQSVKFTEDYARQAEHFLKGYHEMLQPNSRLWAQFDNVASKWKASVTIYKPSHYIRNLIGDIFFNWTAGVEGTKPYTIARKVMQSQKGKYEWDTLDALTSPDALKRALSAGGSVSGPKGSQIALTLKNGQHVTNDMLYISAFQKGLLPSAKVLEDIPDDVARNLLDKIHLPGKLEGRGQEFAHNLHEQRDHFIRLAHYVDALKKSSKPFEQATEEAAAVVRKWHPDGMDMTRFERTVMRRAFPFYSWTRKAIPLAVESIATQPSKVMLYPRLEYVAQQSIMGPDVNSSWQDPFPEDQLWPDWMREKGIGPIGGHAGAYDFLNPSNPVMDIASQFGGIPQMGGEGYSAQGVKGITGMTNPLFQIPAEAFSGTKLSTGAPINDWTQWLTSQIPGVSDLSRVTNYDMGGPSPKATDMGFGNIQNIINLLTAAGYTKTTPKTATAGQFDLRDYYRRQNG